MVCPETGLDVYLWTQMDGWQFYRNDYRWLCYVEGKINRMRFEDIRNNENIVTFKTRDAAVVWWNRYKQRFRKQDWRKDGF